MEKIYRVIIVDDDAKWLDYIAQIVDANFSCVVEKFSDFKEAKENVYTSADFDLLITDIYPSQTSRDPIGLELAKFTKNIRKIPVIIITEEPSAIRPASKYFKVDNVFDKIDFNKLEFIGCVRKAKIPVRIKVTEKNIKKKSFRISRVPIKTSVAPRARLLVFQLETSQDDWRKENGLYFPANILPFKERIHRVLEVSLQKQVTAIVFPELSVPELLVPDIIKWSEENRNILVIAGSHYHMHGNKTVSRCPVIFNGDVWFTEKIFPSPNELSSISGHGLQDGDKVVYFTNTIIGDFFVLICSDQLRALELRDECLKYAPDFVIVPACQLDSHDYYNGMSDIVNHSTDVYYIYSNNKMIDSADGRSAFFGIIRKENRDELIVNGKTDFIPKGKICELKEDEDYYIVDVDIKNKNPPGKRKVGQYPNVVVETGKIFTV